MSGGPQPLPLVPLPSWLGAGAAAPAPAPGGGAAAGGDTKKLDDIKDLLKGTTTGAAAVKYLEDKKVKVEFASGGGSFWDGNKIVIDRNHSTERAALAVVHEVNHARAELEKTGADIAKDTHDDYVRKMLEEEVKGTVDSIKTKNELVAGGTAVTATYPLESKYNDAYKSAVDDLKKADPKAGEPALKAAGEKAGSDAVMKGFKEGSVVTSNTHEKYPDYYGKDWDGHHPKAP